jgi:hypothetical protein
MNFVLEELKLLYQMKTTLLLAGRLFDYDDEKRITALRRILDGIPYTTPNVEVVVDKQDIPF